MTPMPTADDDRLATELLRASRALVGVAARSLAPLDGEVTLQQYRILVLLADRGPQRITDLAGALHLNPSSISRMCDRVESKGLTSRSPAAESRREVTVALTPAGTDLLADVANRRLAELTRIVATVPEQSRATMTSAMAQFAAAAATAPDDAWLLGWAT